MGKDNLNKNNSNEEINTNEIGNSNEIEFLLKNNIEINNNKINTNVLKDNKFLNRSINNNHNSQKIPYLIFLLVIKTLLIIRLKILD